jgi:hypothetical protein
MPISKYYGGHGEKVARAMKAKYGEDWKRVFYATENKRKSVLKKAASMLSKKP